MIMILVRIILVILVFPVVEDSVYMYHTEDSPSIEFYDCVYSMNLLYCRRPSTPISLFRNNASWECYYNGMGHSFTSLRSKNISVSTILHKWKSSIEMVEEYSRYLKQPMQLNVDDTKYLCECSHSQSFGKNCEYFFPAGTTFDETNNWEMEMKSMYPWRVQTYGSIVCYTTLICDYGLLCLDWRNICDGKQQCMSGYDEENCDKLEFNECEDDEYRCMNGMCIPEEYFLDGEYDCMDLTDEKQLFDDEICAFQAASFECDDRVCLPNRWSCGDGQCIKDRLEYQDRNLISTDCVNKRAEYYMCEMYGRYKRWTLPNGKCFPSNRYEELNAANRTTAEECIYLIKCAISRGAEKNCPCNGTNCVDRLNIVCPPVDIQYPNGGIIAPYVYHVYNATHDWKQRQPDFIVINATIKCRGYMTYRQTILPYSLKYNLRDLEVLLCTNSSAVSVLTGNGYDQFCHNDSMTFNNRSYNFIDVCKDSKECISAYRIGDGIVNCQDRMDESQNGVISAACLKLQRHRFRCSVDESTCLPINTLGDFESNCKNNYDESWMGTEMMLSKIDCNHRSKEGCAFIRHYVETSWNSSTNTNNSLSQFNATRIPFRAYCDTFWDLHSKIDENKTQCQTWWICLEEQWQCRTGQCIDKTWLLDGEWDCSDASDEESLFALNGTFSPHNRQIFKDLTVLQDTFERLYGVQAFSSICNISTEYPCFRVNMSDGLYRMTHDSLCIRLEQIGDGHLDCLGGIDERNVQEHCDRPAMLGRDFMCTSSKACITHTSACSVQCPDTHEATVACRLYGLNNDRPKFKDYLCINHTQRRDGRCDDKHDCLFGEDEYMCDRRNLSETRPSNTPYRKQKELYVRNAGQKLHLPQFPLNASSIKLIDELISTNQSVPKLIPSSELNSTLISYPCNRGIGIGMYNGSVACFCPPQYYGDQCQYYSDRVTVYLHLNLSQSIYAESKDSPTVIKLLVLFLFKDQTLTTDEFHVRSVDAMTTYSKKMGYFLYSRSSKLLAEKQARYFNRSSIIHEHPYSVRIEAYELDVDRVPAFIAVWQYPVYFDYLPVFRLAKMLRLAQSKEINDTNPCLSKPCNPHQQCHQLLNQKSRHICLCKSHFTGINCSDLDSMCANNYCSSNALCKPTYRGLLSGNKLPYCICPSIHLGHRCELIYDSCTSNPCKNNGTCFLTLKADQFSCLCPNHYHGRQCEIKTQIVSLSINESIVHEGAVIKCLDIDYSSLDLILVYQHAYYNLPQSFEYRHDQMTAPAIILAKLYFRTQTKTYLISLHLGFRSIEGITQINEGNHCVDVRTLLQTNEDMSVTENSLFKYHRLCRNHMRLFCFLDDSYLCICGKKNYRAECFGYDDHLDQCSFCLAGGRCVKGDPTQANDFICLCPPCQSGRYCQFSSEAFSFSLDSLIAENHMTVQLLYLSPTILMFFAGALTNYASFITFKRPNLRKIGVCAYLLILSLINQCSLLTLFLKIISIPIGFPSDISCKIISYTLSVFTRYSGWLTSWITIERVCFLLFPFNSFLNKPRISIVLSLITLIIIALMHIHELFVYTAASIPEKTTFCTAHFDRLSTYNRVTVLIHYIVPFCVQIVSTTVLIVLAARSRSRVNSNRTMTIKFFRRQFKNHRELYITPVIIILSAIPHSALSFGLACNTLSVSWQRHALIMTYFLSYTPQLLGFVLFVLPSSKYSNEFQQTQLAKKRLFRWITPHKKSIPRSEIHRNS